MNSANCFINFATLPKYLSPIENFPHLTNSTMSPLQILPILFLVSIPTTAIQITPTDSNTTHETYDISYRITSGDSITCATEICIINCSGDNNCKTLEISADASNSLYFSCQGSYTCEDTVISSAPIIEANLICDGRVACRDAQWSIPTTTNVNLLCTTDYDGATSQCMHNFPVSRHFFLSSL